MKNLLKYTLFTFCLTLISCGGGGGGGESEGESPVAAVLISPINNSECITGQEVSATQSKVAFEWNASDFTDTYSVYVKNLNTQQTQQYEANANTSLEVTLAKGTPYSWWVVSKSASSSQSAASEKRKFYNAGSGVISYAPFPADAVSPGMSSSVSGTTVNFQWDGSDVDNDIIEYKLYLDTNNNPSTLKGTTSAEMLNDIPVSGNTTYYWKVVTKDQVGNTSDSPVFQFKTL